METRLTRHLGNGFGAWHDAFRGDPAEAEAFFTELVHGRGVALAPAAEAIEEPASEREPFLGDAGDEAWQVVARPGASEAEFLLADGDLVVTPSGGEGLRAWRVVLAADVDPGTLYGRDGRLRPETVVLRRVRQPEEAGRPGGAEAEIVEACGFFGATSRRTEQEVRDAVAARAEAEWTAWHGPNGAPVRENDPALFGRLAGYYLAAASGILADTLTALQAAALSPAVNYAPLLAAGTFPATVAAEAARIRRALLAGAPGAAAPRLAARVDAALQQAREAHLGAGSASAWSAAFVTTCVRGAAITLGLESVGAGRSPSGAGALLLPALAHWAYALEAWQRRSASPPQRGSYQAFAPAERAPARGDVIVMDRHATAQAALLTFATIPTQAQGRSTHGDVVVEVLRDSVVTIGGNVGDSVRRRRYPLGADGQLRVGLQHRFAQEDATGALPALPVAGTATLHRNSTARVFTVLAPVEDCVAVPGQPVPGGFLV